MFGAEVGGGSGRRHDGTSSWPGWRRAAAQAAVLAFLGWLSRGWDSGPVIGGAAAPPRPGRNAYGLVVTVGPGWPPGRCRHSRFPPATASPARNSRLAPVS